MCQFFSLNNRFYPIIYIKIIIVFIDDAFTNENAHEEMSELVEF